MNVEVSRSGHDDGGRDHARIKRRKRIDVRIVERNDAHIARQCARVACHLPVEQSVDREKTKVCGLSASLFLASSTSLTSKTLDCLVEAELVDQRHSRIALRARER